MSTNSKNTILHVVKLDKFTPPFIDFVEKHFDFKKHEFFILGDYKKYPVTIRSNTIISQKHLPNKNDALKILNFKMQNAKKILLHSLFNFDVVKLLYIQQWILKKCFWAIWGGDLYAYELEKNNDDWHYKESFRRPVIENMGFIVNAHYGDYLLAKKWYNTKAKHISCFMYPSNTFKEQKIKSKKNKDIVSIIIGNSAYPTNNHFNIFNLLIPYRNENIIIYAPLSYGNPDYAQLITDSGKKIFGTKFIPLNKFIPFNTYLRLLEKMDIAIFAHKRQQAMGNIRTLLGMGKKVFMRKDITSWEHLTSKGIKIFDIENFNLQTKFDESATNRKLVLHHFSEKKLIEDLHILFSS